MRHPIGYCILKYKEGAMRSSGARVNSMVTAVRQEAGRLMDVDCIVLAVNEKDHNASSRTKEILNYWKALRSKRYTRPA
jgi:hypothetical protein